MSQGNTAAEPMPPEAFYSRMGGKLGVSRVRSDEDLASLVEKRLPAAAIKSLVRGGLSDAEVYQLSAAPDTGAQGGPARAVVEEESDKAVRVARIATTAERAFRDPEKAWRWLRKPKRRFEGKPPIEMLATEAGARLVEEMILQFEHGIFA